MLKRFNAIAVAVLLLAAGLTVVTAPASQADVIVPAGNNGVVHIMAPAVGATLPTSAPQGFIPGGGWTLSSISWSPADSTAQPATVYTATITLTAQVGYTFTGVSANTFSAFGASSSTNLANSGVITAIYPATQTTLTDLAISGVTAPATGAVPVSSITGSHYGGMVSWSPTIPNGQNFAANTTYTASIVIFPSQGYTTVGVGNFSVAGASSVSQSSAMGFTVSALFPATAAGSGSSAPTLSTASSIANGAVNPSVTLTSPNLQGYTSSSLSSISRLYTVNVGTTGLQLSSATGSTLGTEVLNFTGTAAAGNLTIQASLFAYNPINQSSSNTITIVVPAGSSSSSSSSSAAAAQAAAAQAAAAARQAAVEKARSTLLESIRDKKPVAITDYTASDIAVPSVAAVARINSDVQALQAKTPNVLLTTDAIKAVVKKESVVDLLATPETKGTVLPATLAEVGLLDAKNPNKTSILMGLRSLPSTSLDSYEKVAAAISAQQAAIQARKDKQAAAFARHLALLAKVKR